MLQGGDLVSEDRGIKTRKPMSTTVDKLLAKQLDDLSRETRIPKSKLIDEAIQDLINKHTVDKK